MTAPIVYAVRKLLADDAQVAAILGDRIYFEIADGDAIDPYCIINEGESPPINNLESRGEYAKTTIEVSCYTDSEGAAQLRELRGHVRRVLASYGPALVTIDTDTVYVNSIIEEQTRLGGVRETLNGDDVSGFAFTARFSSTHQV